MKRKLFCFPYAGGSSVAIYSKWKEVLGSEIELIPVEMPGRGRLFGKEHYENVEEAVGDLLQVIEDDIEDCEYGLWGHSMGGMIVYELAKRIDSLGKNKPKNVIVSGKKPLHIPRTDEPVHNLPDEEFIKEVVELNGTPNNFFENKELRELFLPILRKDFKLVYEYKHDENVGNIDIPLTAVMGSKEEISDIEKIRWNELTCGKCKIITLHGDHFFINDNVENMASIIKTALA